MNIGFSRNVYSLNIIPNEMFRRLPFDYTTQCGYFFAFLFEALAHLYAAVAAIGVYTISYAFCQISIVFTKDLSIKEFNFIIMISDQPLSTESCTRLERKL